MASVCLGWVCMCMQRGIYGSVFVRLCAECYSYYSMINEVQEFLQASVVMFTWIAISGFTKQCFALGLWLVLLTLKAVADSCIVKIC